MTEGPVDATRPTGSPWDYAPAAVSAARAPLRSSYGLFVDGGHVEPRAGGHTACRDPRDGGVLAEVAVADAADVDAAVRVARRAQPSWAARPGRERARVLLTLAELLERDREAIAVLETLDSGRPIRHTLEDDLPAAADHLVHHAGWADKLAWAGLGAGPTAHGVLAQLTSSRAPLLALIRDLAPALACGNSVVVKPAGCTPLSALLVAELAREAGLPPGVLAVLTGPAATGEALLGHPDLDAVTFRGPAATLRSVRRRLAGRRTALAHGEAGGDIALVFDDAAVDEAVDGIAQAACCNQGPTSWSTSRLLVQERVHDQLLDALRARLEGCRVGDPLDRNTDVGPLVASDHLRALHARMEATGGADAWSASPDLPDTGWWLAPTIVSAEVATTSLAAVADRGPVIGLQSFRTPAEAVAKADAAWLGGTATIWSATGWRGQSVAEHIRARSVWINALPQTGPPDRGLGVTPVTGVGTPHGLEAFLRPTGEVRHGR